MKLFALLCLVSMAALADEMPNQGGNNGMPPMNGGNAPGINNGNRGNINQVGIYAEPTATGGNVSDGAIRNNVSGNAGVVQGGTSSSNLSASGGSVRTNVGGDSFRYPRQTPMAYAPPAYSTSDCIKAASAGGSGASFGFSVGIGMDSDPCNARADAIRYQEMGLAPVGCQRMMVGDYEEANLNKAAMKASGLSCSQARGVSVAMPATGYVPVKTPTLDDYDHSQFVTKPELNDKLDNIHRIESLK
jgi:hypothetical protein